MKDHYEGANLCHFLIDMMRALNLAKINPAADLATYFRLARRLKEEYV